MFIDTVERTGVNLTEWEKDFIASISKQFTRNKYLSDSQVDTLERIYVEKTP